MKLVFMGTPDFSAHILRALASEHEIALVFTQADKKVGRKGLLTPPPVKVAAEELGIEVFQPAKLRENAEAIAKIAAVKPDFIIVAAYGKILPKSILDLAPCINTHASLLPKYRGASPIQAAIRAGERTSGMTLMHMDEGLDTGDIIFSRELEIANRTAVQVFADMAELGAAMLLEFLRAPENFTRTVQAHAAATHCGIIKKEDALVDFSLGVELIRAHLAYFAWPQVFLASGLKILDIELADAKSVGIAGQILQINKDSVRVACERGEVLLKTVQPAGKKPMNARDYCNGKRLGVGDIFV